MIPRYPRRRSSVTKNDEEPALISVSVGTLGEHGRTSSSSLTVMAMHVVRVIAWHWGEPLGERRREGMR